MTKTINSSRNSLTNLVEQGSLAPGDVDAALEVLQIRPDGHAWRVFIDRLMLWVGGLALAFAALFFIAHNWGEIGRFAKFGLLEGAIALATFAYWKLGPESSAGRMSLLVAAILVGVLLAFIGQTYQTGADPWQLFFYWALLVLPWALISRFAAIWILVILLTNLSLALYHGVSPGLLSLAFDSQTNLVWQLFILNTTALVAWELAARIWRELSVRWATRLLAILGGAPVTWLTLYSLFEGGAFMTGLAWATWLAAMYLVYRRRKHDLFILAGGCLSGILVLTGFAGKYVLFNAGESFIPSSFLLLAALTLGLGAVSATWLKKVHREWQA